MSVVVRPPEKSIVFEAYWKFAAKRQQIYFDRLYNRADIRVDPILAVYRFTNVYRASDRVSQFLIRQVQYDSEWSSENLLFRTLLFKIFNKIETWKSLEQRLGELRWENYSRKKYEECFNDLRRRKVPVYSAAYIMPSGKSAFGSDIKYENHLKLIELIMKSDSAKKIQDKNSLSSVFDFIVSFPMIGSFTGYQYTIDLNYSNLINFDESDFVVAGPGALSGINKCFTDIGSYSPEDIINYMCDIQESAFDRYAPSFQSLWGRRMQPIDCQNVFCEVDKYSRVAYPDITGGSKRARIKQKYKMKDSQMTSPWFPPKWGLNAFIKQDLFVVERKNTDPQGQLQL